MSKSILKRHPFNYLSIATGLLLILIGASVKLYSQTPPGCAPISQSAQAWGHGKTVYYNLSNISDPLIRQQIQAGINAWDSANQSNNSGVRFSSAAPPAGAPTISFQVGGASGSNAAHYDTTINLSTGIIQSARISFYTAGQTPGGNPIYDPTQPGYYAMFLKMTLHEIGHTMGLGDAAVPQTSGGYCDQPNGTTVMNGYCGTNDSGGNLPTTVPQCDQNALNSSDSPYPPPPPGGDPGGGECPCGDCENGCCNPGDPPNEPTCGWVETEGQCYAGVDYYDRYGVMQYSDPGYCDPPQSVYVCW